jgi:hypothetical protein
MLMAMAIISLRWSALERRAERSWCLPSEMVENHYTKKKTRVECFDFI